MALVPGDNPNLSIFRKPPTVGLGTKPPIPTGLRTPGYTPDYNYLLQNDPGYMASRNNSAFALASAGAQRDARLQSLQYDYNGGGNPYSQLAQIDKKLGWLKADTKYNLGNLQADSKYNLGNLNSDYDWNFKNLGEDTADERLLSTMRLAARGVTHSGETPWAQEHIQRAYDRSLHDLQTGRDRGIHDVNIGLERGTHDINTGLERGTYGLEVGRYDAGKSYAEQAADAINAYLGAQENASSQETQGIMDAYGRLSQNPLYQPREGFAQLVNGWEQQYGHPVYQDLSGRLWSVDESGNPVPFGG